MSSCNLKPPLAYTISGGVFLSFLSFKWTIRGESSSKYMIWNNGRFVGNRESMTEAMREKCNLRWCRLDVKVVLLPRIMLSHADEELSKRARFCLKRSKRLPKPASDVTRIRSKTKAHRAPKSTPHSIYNCGQQINFCMHKRVHAAVTMRRRRLRLGVLALIVRHPVTST